MTRRERCESGMADCGPVVTRDSEGVPLCARCAKELIRASYICTPCGNPIPPGRKYLALFPNDGGPSGFRVAIGCDHQPVDCAGAVAIFGSGGCFVSWLDHWLGDLICHHEEAPGASERPS